MRAPGAALSLALLAAAVPARAVDDGPLGVRTPGVFRDLFLDMPLADARGAGEGRLEARWWFANDWSTPTRLERGGRVVWVQQDAQTDVLQLSATLPWTRLRLGDAPWLSRWQTAAELRVLTRWGGWSDGMIEEWHQVIGSWNFEREYHPRNTVHLRLAEEGGRSLADLHGPGTTLSDLVLRTSGRLLAGAPRDDGTLPWALAVRMDLELPTGRVASLGGSGGLDAGLGVAATSAPTRWLTLHGQGALRLVSPLAHEFPLRVAPVQWGLDLGVVVRLGREVALVAENRLSSPLFRGGWSLPAAHKEPEATAYYGLFRFQNQISGGVRYREVTAFFSEDFTPGRRVSGDRGPGWFYNSNAPDFVFGISWLRGL